jgi:uncharacterized protein YqhQ
MSRQNETGKSLLVGGQAVIEGVMMRVGGTVATAVRRTSGEIVVDKGVFASLADRFSVLKKPVLRGALGLIEMLVLGIRTLNYSAEVAFADLQGTHGNGDGAAGSSQKRWDQAKLAVTVVVSLLIGIVIFFLTPLVGATLLFDVEQEPLAFNIVAGLLRIGLLLAYLGLISWSKEIRRLFQYHGAEHKAVFAYERGEQLNVSSAARQSRFHPRCGTSFLLIVMFSAIILFSLLDALLIGSLGQIDLLTRIATHLPLIPLVGGLSYELIKISSRNSQTFIGRVLIAPGLWLQRITTREPDESQLEVALVALRAALEEEHPEIVSASHFIQKEIVLN